MEEEEIGDIHIFHQSVFPLVISAIFLALLGIILSVLITTLLYYLSLNNTISLTAYVIIHSIFFLVMVVFYSLIAVYISSKWLGNIYFIEKKELVRRRGILQITEKRKDLSSLYSVKIEQGIMGRIFNYGNIKMLFKQSVEPEVLENVPSPDHIAKVMEKIFLPQAQEETKEKKE